MISTGFLTDYDYQPECEYDDEYWDFENVIDIEDSSDSIRIKPPFEELFNLEDELPF